MKGARILAAAALLALGCASPDPTAKKDDPNRCAACHMADYAAVTHPMHPGQKPTTCGVCHSQASWHPSRVEHTWFELTNGHAKPSCFDCHRGAPPVFEGLGKKCVGCHRTEYDQAKFPRHSEFPLTCEECHTTSAWKPSTWKTLPSPEPPPSAAPGAPSAPKVAPRPTGKPKPKPAPAPTPAPSSSTPDVVTKPSRRWR